MSVADARVGEASGATLDFTVTLSEAAASDVTVDYATSDGTASEDADYTAASGALTFAAGETEKTISVAVLDDADAEEAETLTLALSNPSGATLEAASATGTIEDDDTTETPVIGEALTAAFTGAPASHGGETFTFVLRFSEDVPGIGWRKLRDEALEASGGEVRNASRVQSGSNQAWNITVEPDGTADVVITLPATTDCEAAGAICTEDDRPLTTAIEARVPNAPRASTRVVSARITSAAGANGTWDTGEIVEAVITFSRRVSVHGPQGVTPTLGITLDGARREATLTNAGPADRFTFTHTVAAADDGAEAAAIVASGITLGGAEIKDGENHAAELSFTEDQTLSVADVTVTEGADATADFVVHLEARGCGDGDGGLRHRRRRGDGGRGLHGRIWHADVRGGRDREDGLGADNRRHGGRRRARPSR